MSRFRLFLAWLIMAAIPLQGLAAASMLFCGPNHGPAPVAAQQERHGQDRADAVHHDEHTKHVDAGEVEAKKADDNTGKKLTDASRKCGVCASCCNSVAVAAFHELVAFGPVPQAELAEPFVLIHARPSQVPDKPPRA
ncbi:hypothetical protein FN976_23975 [Caenimonas sedimenti]|uniref:DUF2946 domain-containing protein n=1 Tax=Caenimonas sedimenti TaxID=2596921 RepID=A0A562ZI68_9BURK|nr:hypothetical protein [Caenimonas sedimenti]TWO68008.1 hypothetical protein FN976_23975 [Caenimonas sedimenti]